MSGRMFVCLVWWVGEEFTGWTLHYTHTALLYLTQALVISRGYFLIGWLTRTSVTAILFFRELYHRSRPRFDAIQPGNGRSQTTRPSPHGGPPVSVVLE